MITESTSALTDTERVADLVATLDRWERNLRSYETSALPGTLTFAEAQRWAHDSQLDLIGEVRDIITGIR